MVAKLAVFLGFSLAGVRVGQVALQAGHWGRNREITIMNTFSLATMLYEFSFLARKKYTPTRRSYTLILFPLLARHS